MKAFTYNDPLFNPTKDYFPVQIVQIFSPDVLSFREPNTARIFSLLSLRGKISGGNPPHPYTYQKAHEEPYFEIQNGAHRDKCQNGVLQPVFSRVAVEGQCGFSKQSTSVGIGGAKDYFQTPWYWLWQGALGLQASSGFLGSLQALFPASLLLCVPLPTYRNSVDATDSTQDWKQKEHVGKWRGWCFIYTTTVQ